MAKTTRPSGHIKSSLNNGNPETGIRGKHLDKVQIAWAAGFMDGEGTISLYKSKAPTCRRGYRYRTTVEVTNTVYEPIRLFQSWFGGKIVKHDNDRFLDGSKGKRKRVYKWYASSIEDSINILEQIEPYLIIKRKQTALCLDFLTNGGSGYKNQYRRDWDAEWDRRDNIYKKIKRLNHRGVPAETEREEGEVHAPMLQSSP